MEIQEYKNIYHQEQKHWWYEGMRKITFSLLHPYFKEGMKILDAGCGTGFNLVKLSEYGECYGIDTSEYALKFCKKRNLKNIRQASIEQTPFENNSFDLITLLDVLYHKNIQEDTRVIKEAHRILKRQGLLFLRVPAFNFLKGPHDKQTHTKKRYTKKDILPLLRENDFTILKSTYANFFLFFPILILRLSQNILNFKVASDIKPTPLLNKPFTFLLNLESFYLKKFNLPFGVSLLILAQKN